MSRRTRASKAPAAVAAVRPSANGNAAPQAERFRDRTACLLLVALIALLHGRALGFGFTGTDDTLQVVDYVPFLADLRNAPKAFGRGLFAVGGAEGYYRPVVTLSYMLDAQWAGARPFAYHATNLLLQMAAVVLLFLLARRLAFSRAITLAVLAVFVTHPSVAQAAAWIPARGDDLLGVWLAGAMLALVHFRETRGTRPLAIHVALFALALFTKENAIVLPAVFVSFGLLSGGDRAWLRDGRLWAGWGVAVLTWFFAWRAVMAGVLKDAPGALAALGKLPVLLQCLGQALNPFHPAALPSVADVSFVPGLVGLAGFIAAAAWLRGARRGLVVWGVAAFALLLAPALPVSHFLILEHRLYAPWMGLVTALLAIAQTIADRGEEARRKVVGVTAVAAAALALLSFDYASAFRDRESFTAQAARSSPRSSLARLSRGVFLQEAGRLDAAQAEYEAALAANPKQLRAHANLGSIAHQKGAVAKAEQLFRQELALNPKDDLAGYNLAVALARQGRLDEAGGALRQALAVNPGNVAARNALADLERRGGGGVPSKSSR